MSRKTTPRETEKPKKLTRAQKKEIDAVLRKYKGDVKPRTAQATIPYEAIYPDGVCRIDRRTFSKCIAFEDISYQLAQPETRTAIFEHLCDLYNYVDVSGSLNVFNHKTNVDIHNRLVAFDIKELGKQLKKLGMLIIQDQIWGRVTQNRSQGRATWYFADEFHLLLKEEQTAAYSAEIWKRFRKWGGVPTGATQNVKDLLSSPEIENILENSDFITLLNQASGDRKILSERLNLSADQQKYIDNSEPGEGLLIFENVVLPFSNPIPKNTQLYKIMTTRLSEVVEL